MMNRIKKSADLLFGFILLALAFTAVQTASAMPVEVRELVIKVVVQPADTNGDGRLEPFSANYRVKADGTAVGTIQLDDACVIDVTGGKIEQDDNGAVRVSVDGDCLRHEVGHMYTVRHDLQAPAYTSGSAGRGNGRLTLHITDLTSGQTNTIQVEGQIFIR